MNAMRNMEEISIHAPRTGSDIRALIDIPLHDVFQSTLPARGATVSVDKALPAEDFNPRSPHGERRTSMTFSASG